MKNKSKRWVVYTLVGGIILILVLLGRFTLFGYIWHQVEDTEIAVQLRQNRVVNVVPPGIYTDTGLWADIVDINVAQIQWCAVDPEVITKDSQRIGLVVCGTVQRPGLAEAERYLTGWSSFKIYYTQDLNLAGKYHYVSNPNNSTEQIVVVDQAGLLQTLAQQAMKVCIGDRTFSQAVIGSARDEVRQCIDDEVSSLAAGYGGLSIENVTVPNVILTPEVQASLDAITKARFDQAVAEQSALTAAAQADEQLAIQSGAIRVEQGRVQEQARQDAITADLQAQALLAQQDVIRQQNANNLLAAELELEVNKKQSEAALYLAQAENADKLYFAELLAANPDYARLLMVESIVPAWSATDKVIIPAGTDPLTIISPWGSGTPVVVAPEVNPEIESGE